ncbi:hypothetical protein FQN52_007654 [Onygenales sp. PD_12]|nr:hypothetical protein FQN52_007654 [Onygenales sp. PD_12]
MKFTVGSVLLSALALQQANATFNWPSKGHCSEPEKHGLDCGDIPLGDFSFWKGFEFKGFSRKDFGYKNFFGKGIESMFKSNKVIEAKVGKGIAFPSFGKDGGFWVKKFELSVEVETDLEIHFTMPDGSICKQKSHCKPEGTVIKNTHCGGAVSVSFELEASVDIDFTFIALHHIDFDCDDYPTGKPTYPAHTHPVETYPAETYPAEPEPTETYPAHTHPVETYPAETYPAEPEPTEPYPSGPKPTDTYSTGPEPTNAHPTGPEPTGAYPTGAYPTGAYPTGAYPVPSSSDAYPTNPTSYPTSAPPSVEPTYTTSTFYSTTVETVTKCPPTVTNCPSGSGPGGYVTKTIPIYTTICPVSPTYPANPPKPSTYSPNPTYPGYNTTIPTYPPSTLTTYRPSGSGVEPYPPIYTGAASSLSEGSMAFIAASLFLAGLAQF